MASGHRAVINVNFAYKTKSTGWTGTCKVVDQIMTSTTVLTRIWSAVVNVEFAILTLETLGAMTLVRANEVLAGCSVLTWSRITLVYLFLTVRASVTVEAVTTMTIAYVFAGAVVAKTVLWYAFPYGSVFARNHLHVAYLASPSGRAIAVILIHVLHARCLVLAWIFSAPVYEFIALLTRVTIRTVARIVLYMIMTSSTVLTG